MWALMPIIVFQKIISGSVFTMVFTSVLRTNDLQAFDFYILEQRVQFYHMSGM